MPIINASFKKRQTKGRINALERREGFCEKCGTKVEKLPTVIIDRRGNPKDVLRPLCPECGGQGKLIVRAMHIDYPEAPDCISPRCLFRFMRDSLFFALLSSYDRRRIAYAQKHKHDDILDRYRTGDPAPKTIWQAIHANIKLACPICRKYDVDPLLFDKGGQ